MPGSARLVEHSRRRTFFQPESGLWLSGYTLENTDDHNLPEAQWGDKRDRIQHRSEIRGER
jgi:hypothetical protein